MRLRNLLIPAAAVFVVVLLATLPASLVAGRLPASVVLDGSYGSVFSGGAEQLLVNGTPLGAVEWSFRPGALLGLALGYHVDLEGPDGAAHGDLASGLGGTLTIERLKATMPIATLTRASGQATSLVGNGRVTIDVRRARLVRGWPVEIDGTLLADALQPAMVSRPIGSYEVRFSPPGAGAPADAPLAGTLHDVKAPLSVAGTVALARDRTYVIEGTIATRGETPAEVLPALDAFGPADRNGKRAFSIGGAF